MSVSVGRHSRLLFAELLKDSEGRQFFDRLSFPPLEPQTDDAEITVAVGDRLDSLAQRIYGDAKLQWVLALANGIDLWPTQLNPNLTLRVPSARYVLQVWLTKATPRTR